MKALLFTSTEGGKTHAVADGFQSASPFGILLRLRHASRRFKEMLLALSYTAALLGLFWFMNKVADDHGVSSGITGSVLK